MCGLLVLLLLLLLHSPLNECLDAPMGMKNYLVITPERPAENDSDEKLLYACRVFGTSVPLN